MKNITNAVRATLSSNLEKMVTMNRPVKAREKNKWKQKNESGPVAPTSQATNGASQLQYKWWKVGRSCSGLANGFCAIRRERSRRIGLNQIPVLNKVTANKTEISFHLLEW